MIGLQRDIAHNYDLVADGRDCGSVVFPDADYKFFLTANLDVRARRVLADEMRLNKDISLEEVKKELEVRDQRDRERKVAPLTVPDNAIIIDNSNMSREETIKEFLRFIR